MLRSRKSKEKERDNKLIDRSFHISVPQSNSAAGAQVHKTSLRQRTALLHESSLARPGVAGDPPWRKIRGRVGLQRRLVRALLHES